MWFSEDPVRGAGRQRYISVWAAQIVKESEISFAAGTLSDDTLGVCPSVCGCIYIASAH